jgi:ATP-dependent Clp endopeptidase proteolytic subunit ClpP
MNTEIIANNIVFDNFQITNDEISVKIAGDINTECANVTCEKLLELDKKNLPFIPFLIHSCGGNVDDMLSIINTIDSCSTPIMTICQSCACSAAAVIFAFGSTGMRIMAPNSYLMFHGVSMGLEGKALDLAAQNNHYLKIDKMINKKLEKHLDISANFFDDHIIDLYLNAKEALKLGICSHVGFPVIKLKIGLEMSHEIKINKRHETEDYTKRAKFLKTYSGACALSNVCA